MKYVVKRVDKNNNITWHEFSYMCDVIANKDSDTVETVYVSLK